jgi:hypothetical protein
MVNLFYNETNSACYYNIYRCVSIYSEEVGVSVYFIPDKAVLKADYGRSIR